MRWLTLLKKKVITSFRQDQNKVSSELNTPSLLFLKKNGDVAYVVPGKSGATGLFLLKYKDEYGRIRQYD